LAKSIYGQQGGPKDFGEVVIAARKEMEQLLKETVRAYPELAVSTGLRR